MMRPARNNVAMSFIGVRFIGTPSFSSERKDADIVPEKFREEKAKWRPIFY